MRLRPALSVVLLAAGPAALADTTPPPNVVVILADDMGYGDVRALNPGSAIPTPHLDRLAAEGMTFTDAHTPSSVCTPTRYGLLTGRYAWRGRLKRGVLDGYGEPLIESGSSDPRVLPAAAAATTPRRSGSGTSASASPGARAPRTSTSAAG